MGYAELVRALEDETDRQVAALADDGARRAADLVAAARAATARAREQALAAEERSREAAVRRAVAIARADADRAVLVEMRRLLAELRAAAAPPCPTVRLVTELLPEIAGQRALLTVPDDLDAVRALAPDTEVVAGPPGVVRAALGPLLLDNSPSVRLARAWPALEPELARLLFGEPDGA
jgi:hypothetical protein